MSFSLVQFALLLLAVDTRRLIHDASCIRTCQNLLLAGIWLKLKPEHATLLATAYEHGFEMHHANKKHMVLVKWLQDTPSTIPISHTYTQ